MVELHDIYTVLYAGAAVLALVVAFVAWRHRAARGAVPIAVLTLGIAIWSGAAAAMWHVPTLGQQVFWERTESFGAWMVPVGFLTLAFDVAGMRRWRTPVRIALISIASFALVNIEWLNPGRLFDKAFVAQTVGPYTHFAVVPGLLYWAFAVFAYTTTALAFVIILRVCLRSCGAERIQAATLLSGGLVPFIASVVTEFRSVPLGIDLAPLAFLVTGILWLSAILRGTLLDILPLARDVLVEQMSDGVVVVDGEDHVVDANPAALAMLHAPLAEVLGTSAAVLLAGVEGACALLGGSGPRHAVLTIGSDGVSRHVDIVIMPLNAGLGNPSSQLMTLHDVTEERRVHAQAELLAAIVTSSQDAMLTSDLDGIVRSWNAAAERLFGYRAQEMIGTSLAVLMVAGSEDLPKQITERVRGGAEERIPNFESRGKRKDGSEVDVSLVFSPVFDDTGAVAAVSAIAHDVTEMKEAEDKIRHNATHDALTGLPNRFLLDDRLEHALADARRVGSGLAVLFLDLDNFKVVNDTLGHGQGDALLAEVAKRIVPVLRESDTVGRVGGDEFTIIIAGVEDSAQVEVTARRLLEAIASPCRLGAEDLHVTASVGVALFPMDGTDATSLIQHADLAMYGAKELGRNRTQFFSQSSKNVSTREVPGCVTA